MALFYLTKPVLSGNTEIPLIRKIFRVGPEFFCGLCRTKYTSEDPALECLDSCWTDVINKDPVVPCYVNGREQFKCRFCCRIYKELDDVVSCAEDCLKIRKSHHYADMKVYEIPVAEFSMRDKYVFASTRQEIKANYISKFNFNKKSEPNIIDPKEETTEPIATDIESPMESEIKNSETESNEEAAIIRRSKADFPKPFIRNNAKYQCMFCRELYFTKMEVDSCFERHFDENGLELV